MTAFLQHRIGDLVDERYEVRSVLGSGAFGTVYLCRDIELEIEVAVKELHVLDAAERGPALEKFRAEAVNLSRLRHPHIVSGHYEPHNGTWLICPVCGLAFRGTARCPEHGAAPVVVKTRHYLVMEYLDGPDLEEAARAAGGAMPVPQALHYIRQIADALKMIHARGLVHRDIKPENIRLRAKAGTAGDDAVLLDFGIASETGAAGEYSTRAHRHTTGGGTFGYAPDSPDERRFPDARSDIHALGMTLYRLVSGCDPLDDTDLQIMRRRRPSELNAAISTPLEKLIVSSISTEPTARPGDATEFLATLDAMLAPPVPAPSPSVAVTGAMAFTFRSGSRATDAETLVRLMDAQRAEGKEYLYSGEAAAWLARIGRYDLAQSAREVVDEYPDRRYQGLEAFAQRSGLEPPRLEVWPTALDFGVLPPDGHRTLILKMHNAGRGHLFGFLRSGDDGLSFPEGFEGNRHNAPVTLNARPLPPGDFEGEVVIDSSAGEVRIPVVATIQGEASAEIAGMVWGWSVVGCAIGCALRLVPFGGDAVAYRWLPDVHSFRVQDMAAFALVAWIALLVLAVGEGTRRKSWATFLSSSAAALPVALVCGAFAGQLIRVGDYTLHPILTAYMPDADASGVAPWAWMAAGGTAGAAYGTLRRAGDLFSVRVIWLLCGWLLLAVTLFGAWMGLAKA